MRFPQHLLTRVDGLFLQIALYVVKNGFDLPPEARKLIVPDGVETFPVLNLFLRDRVLDDYLKQHPKFRYLVSQIYGSKYSYLLDQDLVSHDIHPEDESTGLPDWKAAPETKDTWVVDYMKGGRSEELAQRAFDSFDRYDLAFEGTGETTIHGPITLEEFELLQEAMDFLNKLPPPPVPRAWTPPPDEPIPTKNTPGARGPLGQAMRMAGDNVQFGTDVVMDITPLGPYPGESYTIPIPPEIYKKQQETATKRVLDEQNSYKGLSTIGDMVLHPYKGWKIAGPNTQLSLAKNFLADSDADRVPAWPRKFAELVEYTSYLTYNYAGEDWGPDLKEVVDMLHTHWVFENQHYGRPKLLVDFPDAERKRDARLVPPASGPAIVLDGGWRDAQMNPLVPREILNRESESLFAGLGGMPLEILETIYQPRLEEDAERVWIDMRRGWEHDPGPGFNSAYQEKKTYERCMAGGIDTTLDVLNTDGYYVYSPDAVSTIHGHIWIDPAALYTFATCRGANRALMEQSLNTTGNYKQEELTAPFNTMVLPDFEDPLETEKNHPGIIYNSMMVSDAPKDESRDPFGYARWHCWLRREQSRWAEWIRHHSIKEAYGQKKYENRTDPILDVPLNFRGPVTSSLLDVEMQQRLQDSRRCKILAQKIHRLDRQVPGKFPEMLISMMNHGLAGTDYDGLKIKFRADEFPSGRTDRPCLLRPKEYEWLEFLCKPTVNFESSWVQPLGPHGQVLIDRVRRLLDDISPSALFNDVKPKTVNELLEAVNQCCAGPVKRHVFGKRELLEELPRLVERGVLDAIPSRNAHGMPDTKGKILVQRPLPTVRSEERIHWSDSAEDQKMAEAAAAEAEAEGNDASSESNSSDGEGSDWTISTKVSIPGSENFGDYDKHLPLEKNLRCAQGHLDPPELVNKDLAMTKEFYRSLAFRLGTTMSELAKLCERDAMRMRDPERQFHNARFMRHNIKTWDWDAHGRPNHTDDNPSNVHSDRVTPLYYDIVKVMDPDEAEPQEPWPTHPDADKYRTMTRDGMLRELSENKPMLWPVARPPTIGRNDKETQVKTYGRKVIGPNPEGPLCREPVWTFGHPSMKPSRGQHWDMMNWPVHQQTAERQREIRARVPERSIRSVDPDGVPEFSEALPVEDVKQTYTELGHQKQKFTSGPAEFWQGDTPFQRKAFVDQLRANIESAPAKTWRQRISSLIFGSPPETEEEPLGLPAVDPKDVLVSRPPPVVDSPDNDVQTGDGSDWGMGPSVVGTGSEKPLGLSKGVDVDGDTDMNRFVVRSSVSPTESASPIGSAAPSKPESPIESAAPSKPESPVKPRFPNMPMVAINNPSPGEPAPPARRGSRSIRFDRPPTPEGSNGESDEGVSFLSPPQPPYGSLLLTPPSIKLEEVPSKKTTMPERGRRPARD